MCVCVCVFSFYIILTPVPVKATSTNAGTFKIVITYINLINNSKISNGALLIFMTHN